MNLHNNVTIVILWHVRDPTTPEKYSFHLYPVPKTGNLLWISSVIFNARKVRENMNGNLLVGNRWWVFWCNALPVFKPKTVVLRDGQHIVSAGTPVLFRPLSHLKYFTNQVKPLTYGIRRQGPAVSLAHISSSEPVIGPIRPNSPGLSRRTEIIG